MLAYYACFVVLGYKAASFGVPSLHLLGYPFGEGEGEKMRWYNPTRRVAESVLAPYTRRRGRRHASGSHRLVGLPYGVREAQGRRDGRRAGPRLRGAPLQLAAPQIRTRGLA